MLTAEQYRTKAAEYTELMKSASMPAEGSEFRRLGRSYRMLAENEEWMEDNREKKYTLWLQTTVGMATPPWRGQRGLRSDFIAPKMQRS